MPRHRSTAARSGARTRGVEARRGAARDRRQLHLRPGSCDPLAHSRSLRTTAAGFVGLPQDGRLVGSAFPVPLPPTGTVYNLGDIDGSVAAARRAVAAVA